MKLELQIGLLGLLMAGCATQSPFANDPRAAVVGPAFLDYIHEFPRDQATQYYYPRFSAREVAEIEAPGAPSNVPPDVQRLIMTRPKPTTHVMATEGQGWPDLEKDGIPFFWGVPEPMPQVIPPAPAPTPAPAAKQSAAPESAPKAPVPGYAPIPETKQSPDLTPSIR
jgi:hypothetical protein